MEDSPEKNYLVGYSTEDSPEKNYFDILYREGLIDIIDYFCNGFVHLDFAVSINSSGLPTRLPYIVMNVVLLINGLLKRIQLFIMNINIQI